MSKLPMQKKEGSARSALSGRGSAALLQYQRRLSTALRQLQSSDRTLAGALLACDAGAQMEMLGNYLECVQEVRAAVQHLEGFLLTKLARSLPDRPTDAS